MKKQLAIPCMNNLAPDVLFLVTAFLEPDDIVSLMSLCIGNEQDLTPFFRKLTIINKNQDAFFAKTYLDYQNPRKH